MTVFIARRFTDLSRRIVMRSKLQAYKANLHCEHCGETFPYCLEFHHLDPESKEMTVTQAIRQRWSWRRIMAEIKKCKVLCSNCHRKVHHPHITCRPKVQINENISHRL